jgi:4,5-DOPA dioxygenase extradiol
MRLPAFFLGHGNPMHALGDNAWTRSWAAIGREWPAPRAVLAVSAHWFVPGLAVTAMPDPRTIHDFGGFPKALFEVQYPAPGDPQLARDVVERLAPLEVHADMSWGLDHGTWSLLCHIYPDAGVPVVQLSIDQTRPPSFHYEIGQRLRGLRDEGILLIGSGNVVHNLRRYAWGSSGTVQAFDWAQRFEALVRERVKRRDHASLVNYASLGPDAALSAPTPEHYLPLLYMLGASHEDDAITFPSEGMDGGSISMLGIRFG